MKQKSNLFKTLGIMLLFVLFATQANAQNITVTGTVSDNLGPVIGASIQVEGTSNGCITGEFYQFNLSSCIRQQNSLTAQFVSFSLSNLANIFYPPQFLQ